MLRDHPITQNKLKNDLGSVVLDALKDPQVIEIMLNPDGKLWVDTYNGMRECGEIDSEVAKNLINTVASISNTNVSFDCPNVGGDLWVLVDGQMKNFRFQGVIPPVAPRPMFSIRKPSARVITLEEYLEKEVMTLNQYNVLREAVSQRDSVLVVGGTLSGKTTLCNALLDSVAKFHPNDRIAIIEDTIELQCNVRNMYSLRVSDTRTMDDLLRYTLRLRPDRIVVGEVRGKEAYSLIKAWNTGHPGGLSTIHANSALSGLLRLEQLISEVGVMPVPESIAEAINLVVYIEKSSQCKVGRKLKEIIKIKGFEKNSGYKQEVLG